MIKKSSRFINKRLGPFKLARWGKPDLEKMATDDRFKNYRLEFIGISIAKTGYYIGFMIGRRENPPLDN